MLHARYTKYHKLLQNIVLLSIPFIKILNSVWCSHNFVFWMWKNQLY